MTEREERHSSIETLLSKVSNQESFDALYIRVVDVLREIKDSSPDGRLGYVSGILTSDGPEHLERNREILQEKTERARKEHDFPIFCANDIFKQETVERLGHRGSDYLRFWRKILETGLITDVIMTKGWDRSLGATDEHTTAEILGLNIKYEKETLAYKPPTGHEPQDKIRTLFIEGNEDKMEKEKTLKGEIWTRSELNLGRGEKMLISNISDSRIAVRGVRPDQVFQFGMDENGISWIEGVYKATEEEVKEVYEPEEIDEGEEERIYIKEFFGDRLGSTDTLFSTDRVFNDQKEMGNLLGDLYYWVRDALENEEIPDLPESAKKYIKPKTWTRLRL